MNACDSCAWIERCVASGRCAREPLTVEQEERVRQLVIETVAKARNGAPVFIGIDLAKDAERFDSASHDGPRHLIPVPQLEVPDEG